MSDASPLRPALSFAFFTQFLLYVPQSRWRESVPHDIDLQKYYYNPEIEQLQEDAKSVQGLGPGAAEEWIKGLPLRGQLIQKSATQWEDWELNGGLDGARHALFPHENRLKRLPASTALDQRLMSTVPSTSASSLPITNVVPAMPLQSYGAAPGTQAPPGLPPKPSDASSMGSQTSSHRHKIAPSSRELAKNRAYKKIQIVERCRVLSPPIHREMLERLDAFHSALQVPMPLNDSSWEALKTLLRKQRTQIELQDEARNSVRIAPIPGQFTAPSRSDEYVIAHADAPLKEKLCEIAKEFIKQRFGHGGWVTYPTAPQFAAEVLIHAREMYFEEKARIQALQLRMGSATLTVQQDEKLRYEHMKWVFDQTIRPQTEQIRKDLFLCANCPTGAAVKYFAFESMIQHFIYKHDPSFTTGTPKAFWQCEWPEVPPFNVHPERVHTPEPSITHTPTLSHQQLSIMSPRLNPNMAVPPGRRTPDTMSLLSGNTNPFSASGRSARTQNQAIHLPGSAMYELQQNSLAFEMSRGWKLVMSAPEMPLNLLIYLTLGFAIATFNIKYKNEPPLNLFDDCISKQSELNELQNLGPLRCAECAVGGPDGAQTEWSLQDLVTHFRKMHVENNHSRTKPDWKYNMISLPDPALIKGLLSNADMPTVLHNLLVDAETTAAIQKATANPFKPTSIPQYEPLRPPEGTRNSHPDSSIFTPVNERERYESFGYPEYQHRYLKRVPLSTAATYGDLNSAQDTWSASSHTVGAEKSSSLGSSRPNLISRTDYPSYTRTAIYPERPLTSVETRSFSASRRPTEPQEEAVDRSDILQSHRSRGENVPQTIAEDFLSAIDAQLDVEMGGSEPSDTRNTHTSQPISRTNSTRGPGTRISHRTSPDRGEEGVRRRPSESSTATHHQHRSSLTAGRDSHVGHAKLVDEIDPPLMERQPSRVIEFDHQGNPVSDTGQVYQELSPPRKATSRQYVDHFGRLIEPVSPTYAHGFTTTAAANVPSVHYVDDRHLRYTYAPLEYTSADVYRPERIVDPVTGRTYVAERPYTRQLIEIGSPQSPPDNTGRPTRYGYREVDHGTHRIEDLRYERPPTGYQERRYQSR